MEFHHRYALVTGSSRGIGRAIALKLASQRIKIAVHYHQDEEAARDTLRQIQDLGSDGFIVQADITQPQAIAYLFNEIEDKFGRLNILVSNARPDLSTFYHSPLKMTVDHWRAAVDSQAQAFLLSTQKAADLMPDNSRIIVISCAPGSQTGSWQPWAGMGTAKVALESLCRYFAVALAPRRITVNSISPGCILGESNSLEGGVLRSLPEFIQATIQYWHESGWTPMQRVGTPADVANAVMLLCLPEASFITGQTICVDGGASIMDTAYPLAIQVG